MVFAVQLYHTITVALYHRSPGLSSKNSLHHFYENGVIFQDGFQPLFRYFGGLDTIFGLLKHVYFCR